MKSAQSQIASKKAPTAQVGFARSPTQNQNAGKAPPSRRQSAGASWRYKTQSEGSVTPVSLPSPSRRGRSLSPLKKQTHPIPSETETKKQAQPKKEAQSKEPKVGPGERLSNALKVSSGQPEPHGCSQPKSGNAINFSLPAPDTEDAWLVLIIPPGHPYAWVFLEQEQYLKLDDEENRTGDTWHLELTLIGIGKKEVAGVQYVWLLDPKLDEHGQPLASAHRTIDPYARALDSNHASEWNVRGSQGYSVLPCMPDFRSQDFDWQGVASPSLHMKDLIIYEAHVRGFTMHKDSGVTHPGTFLGFVEKIPHLSRLGVNCVELMPIFEFDETACTLQNPATKDQLCNYWGYSSVAFFVPMQRFSSGSKMMDGRISSAMTEFKILVRELHRNGIQVILDVAFNQSALGKALGDNTVNANDPSCAKWILECLRYWVQEMHVDGFRFDQAVSLCRGSKGQMSDEPHLIKSIVEDPKLSHVKLIAEPWEGGSNAQLEGKFPSCGKPRFAEWNRKFRDDIRRFIKGDPSNKPAPMKCEFASRICGSSDLFEENERAPFHSINFITSHAGFTLADLVSFNKKQNACNGENGGDDHNNSWNCGEEGETDDEKVEHLREKQTRNFLVALFTSVGTPMLNFGDEYGRTQKGCNNGWCQDALSWFSWDACSKQEDGLFRFSKHLIAMRKRYSHIFACESFIKETDILWRHNFTDHYNYLCYVRHDRKADKPYSLLVAFNAGPEVRKCDLTGITWYRIIDSEQASPKDICEDEASAEMITTRFYEMQPYSCIVLKTYETMQTNLVPTNDRVGKEVLLRPGQSKPHGCSQSKSCNVVNFALHTGWPVKPASDVWIALIIPQGHACASLFPEQKQFVKLDPEQNRTGDVWHVEVELAGKFSWVDLAGLKYAWLLDPEVDNNGQPSSTSKHVLDPYATELDTKCARDWNVRGGAGYMPSAVVPDRRLQEFDWQGVVSPRRPMKDLIIYEAHVRGFTMNRDSRVKNPGTFLGFIEKIPHLVRLGINCVEFLPIFEFDESCCPLKNPLNGAQLCNYWGYMTVAYFVPMHRFSSGSQFGDAITELKTLVRELHRNGIEVILDVVFNHTGEGCWGTDNWSCWSKVSKAQYYLLWNGQHTNYTGCGNTMNANDPICTEWIIECLRYWVQEVHVDGFRFDLASSLCRNGNGQIHWDPHLIKTMVQDTILSDIKLIAEPWDCAWPDGYLVGKFPSCGPPRFAEWNGKYRDGVRCFIKGDPCIEGEPARKAEFATRICGSADLFETSGRSPFHSINFVTCHDGFTLKDLVSYNFKSNACNGENSGEEHNHSWNCGTFPDCEGKTQDIGVQLLREKQMRNHLVALFTSAGTPMMTCGDEYGRSQDGCNNGWCQDNMSWFSWSDCWQEQNGLVRFCRLLIAMRKEHGNLFNREHSYTEKDISWRSHWEEDNYNYMCFMLHDRGGENGDSDLLVAFNAGHEVVNCPLDGREWYRKIDTSRPPPEDICEDEASAAVINGSGYDISPYSCIVLKSYQTFLEYRFEITCEWCAPNEGLCLVGSEAGLGSWDADKAIGCTTNAKEFPKWTSAIVMMPPVTRKFEFKLLRKGENEGGGYVVWEEAENHQAMLRAGYEQGQNHFTVRTSWGSVRRLSLEERAELEELEEQENLKRLVDLQGDEKMPKDEGGYQFVIRCEYSAPNEGLFIVGAEVGLGSWDPDKAIQCMTNKQKFPWWTSPIVMLSSEFEFKLVRKGVNEEGEAYVVWEEAENHQVVSPFDGQSRVNVQCAWGQTAPVATHCQDQVTSYKMALKAMQEEEAKEKALRAKQIAEEKALMEQSCVVNAASTSKLAPKKSPQRTSQEECIPRSVPQTWTSQEESSMRNSEDKHPIKMTKTGDCDISPQGYIASQTCQEMAREVEEAKQRALKAKQEEEEENALVDKHLEILKMTPRAEQRQFLASMPSELRALIGARLKGSPAVPGPAVQAQKEAEEKEKALKAMQEQEAKEKALQAKAMQEKEAKEKALQAKKDAEEKALMAREVEEAKQRAAREVEEAKQRALKAKQEEEQENALVEKHLEILKMTPRAEQRQLLASMPTELRALIAARLRGAPPAPSTAVQAQKEAEEKEKALKARQEEEAKEKALQAKKDAEEKALMARKEEEEAKQRALKAKQEEEEKEKALKAKREEEARAKALKAKKEEEEKEKALKAKREEEEREKALKAKKEQEEKEKVLKAKQEEEDKEKALKAKREVEEKEKALNAKGEEEAKERALKAKREAEVKALKAQKDAEAKEQALQAKKEAEQKALQAKKEEEARDNALKAKREEEEKALQAKREAVLKAKKEAEEKALQAKREVEEKALKVKKETEERALQDKKEDKKEAEVAKHLELLRNSPRSAQRQLIAEMPAELRSLLAVRLKEADEKERAQKAQQEEEAKEKALKAQREAEEKASQARSQGAAKENAKRVTEIPNFDSAATAAALAEAEVEKHLELLRNSPRSAQKQIIADMPAELRAVLVSRLRGNASPTRTVQAQKEEEEKEKALKARQEEEAKEKALKAKQEAEEKALQAKQEEEAKEKSLKAKKEAEEKALNAKKEEEAREQALKAKRDEEAKEKALKAKREAEVKTLQAVREEEAKEQALQAKKEEEAKEKALNAKKEEEAKQKVERDEAYVEQQLELLRNSPRSAQKQIIAEMPAELRAVLVARLRGSASPIRSGSNSTLGATPTVSRSGSNSTLGITPTVSRSGSNSTLGITPTVQAQKEEEEKEKALKARQEEEAKEKALKAKQEAEERALQAKKEEDAREKMRERALKARREAEEKALQAKKEAEEAKQKVESQMANSNFDSKLQADVEKHLELLRNSPRSSQKQIIAGLPAEVRALLVARLRGNVSPQRSGSNSTLGTTPTVSRSGSNSTLGITPCVSRSGSNSTLGMTPAQRDAEAKAQRGSDSTLGTLSDSTLGSTLSDSTFGRTSSNDTSPQSKSWVARGSAPGGYQRVSTGDGIPGGYVKEPSSRPASKARPAVQEYEFLVKCDNSQPNERLFLVGSEVALGKWDPTKAIECLTNKKEFPTWTSSIVTMPSGMRKFEFKLLRKGEGKDGGYVVWEAGENNHEVELPQSCEDQVRVTLQCSWGQKASPYSYYVPEMSQSVQEFQFLIKCENTLPTEGLYLVGSEVALGSFDPTKAIQCTTKADEFPTWTSSTVMLPSNTRKFEFKLLKKGEGKEGGYVFWEEGENHQVDLPARSDEQNRVTLECDWGQTAPITSAMDKRSTSKEQRCTATGSCEYQFLIKCEHTKEGEVLFLVGSEAALGSWDPTKAIQCSTNAKEYPIWTSYIVKMPFSTISRMFEFKLFKKGENKQGGYVVWEEAKDNHTVLLPPSSDDQDRVVLPCSWGQTAPIRPQPTHGQAKLPPKPQPAASPTTWTRQEELCIEGAIQKVPSSSIVTKECRSVQEFEFLVECNDYMPNEKVYIVGSEVGLGSWDAGKAIQCFPQVPPTWKSSTVMLPSGTGKFAFKLLRKGENEKGEKYEVWEDKAGNHEIVLPPPSADDEADKVTIRCSWGQLAPVAPPSDPQLLRVKFVIECEHTTPTERLFLVGSEMALGSWDFTKAIPCITNAKEFPKWTSYIVPMPSCTRKFEFKLFKRGVGGKSGKEVYVTWEDGKDNHQVALPPGLNAEERVTLQCSWGQTASVISPKDLQSQTPATRLRSPQALVSRLAQPTPPKPKAKAGDKGSTIKVEQSAQKVEQSANQGFRFVIKCDNTAMGESLFLVGSEVALGSWDATKAVACTTDEKNFPTWTSSIVMMPSGTRKLEFKLLKKGSNGLEGCYEVWEDGKINHAVVLPESSDEQDQVTLQCTWGQVASPYSYYLPRTGRPVKAFVFSIECDKTKEGEDLFLVGSEPTLGFFDPAKAIPCTTKPNDFPTWTSSIVMLPACYCDGTGRKIEFKLLKKGKGKDGGYVAWEEMKDNHQVVLPESSAEQDRITLQCTWGQLTSPYSYYVPKKLDPESSPSVQEYLFSIECANAKNGEEVFLVGSEPALGSFDPTKAIPCTTNAKEFPMWTSSIVMLPFSTRKFEFKLLKKKGTQVFWEPGPNHPVVLPKPKEEKSDGSRRKRRWWPTTLNCSWGQTAAVTDSSSAFESTYDWASHDVSWY